MGRIIILGGGFGGLYAALRLPKLLAKVPRAEKKLRVVPDWTRDLFFSKDLVQYTTFRPPVPARVGVADHPPGHGDRSAAAAA